jgi:hypothetical protein
MEKLQTLNNMKDIIYSLSKTNNDFIAVASLVKKEYIKQGYINFGEEISAPKKSVVFIAKYNKKIIGTVCVAIDSGDGLPMDEIYKEEVDKLRSQNKKIVEVCRLATDSDFLTKDLNFKKKYNSLFLVSSLFKLVFHYCLYKNFDNICIAINPKHELFYKSLFFNDMGSLKYYPSVNNAPAVAKTLEINKFKNKNIKNYLLNKLFFDNPPDYKIFES